ncbi:hypothetical protein, partial [Pseudomonas aeruginosa]|uniref:hypothetical protein n=1 Tax=Pseudomonas aeruginosa TaxID=287 RepID=UPI002340C9C6
SLYAGVILAIPCAPATCQKTQRSFFGSHFIKIYSFIFNKLLKFTERFWQTSRTFIYLGSHAV